MGFAGEDASVEAWLRLRGEVRVGVASLRLGGDVSLATDSICDVNLALATAKACFMSS
jgi:hypothetical protein